MCVSETERERERERERGAWFDCEPGFDLHVQYYGTVGVPYLDNVILFVCK